MSMIAWKAPRAGSRAFLCATRMMSYQAVGRRILSEEELAAENIYVKKMEKEKLDKLKHKEEAGGNSSVRQPKWVPASVKSKESSANK